VAIGYFLPSVIGVCVRQYLQSIGKPVMTWSEVGHMLLELTFLSLIWVLPFASVALFTSGLLTDSKYRGFAYGAFLGTALCEVPVFIAVWEDGLGEVLFYGFLIIPIFLFGGMFLGGALGYLAGWLVGRVRHSRSAPQLPANT
jgi:hypothetical protein